MRKTLISILWAIGTFGLQPAVAQQAVHQTSAVAAAALAPLVPGNPALTSSRAVTPTAPVIAVAQTSETTKVVQIYGGAGRFDLALAERLRPTLIKGLAATRPNSLPVASGPFYIPAKADRPKKVMEANL